MNLDPIAGGLCGISAASVFYIHSASGPDRKSWINLPDYVRFGFAVAGVALTLWSVDLFSISTRDVELGHINRFGAFSAAAIAYLAVVSAICIYRNRLHKDQWAGMQEVEQTLRASDASVAAAIPRSKIATVISALGAWVNATPPATVRAPPPDPENKTMR